jgi:hypothetical protein
MAVDLSTNNKAISEVYKKIVSGTDPTDWYVRDWFLSKVSNQSLICAAASISRC